MADVVIAPVVPPVVLAGRGKPGGRSDGSLRRRPLPLPDLPTPRVGTLVYGVAALDASGRIADSGVVRALGWVPGTRLHIHAGAGLVVLRADRQGVFTVTGQGHLRLPAAARQWCGLTAGDRVLLAACPADRLLVVHPPAAVDAMVVPVHAAVLGGGRP
ncbi:hypothetical protein ACN265_08905 [Micromonospora sp. WMMD730]|uniref:hypothetical protein n=1 Tax=Micromonospora sp. WMMD730 TaxID=3404128 RepID=UPI003B93871C